MIKLKLALFTALFALLPSVHASEGGASGYMQGTYNDFAAGMIGPAGFYARNDLFFYDASIGVRPLGGKINGGVNQSVWVDTIKLSWVSDWKILGGTYSAAIALPILILGDVSGTAAGFGFDVFRGGDVSGLADIFMLPFQLNWTWGNNHLNFAPGILAPTGSYAPDKLLNAGRNYWAVDPAFSYTWLHPKRGHEISLTTGFMINMQNPDTHYTTGNEFHLDWLVSQHFSEYFAIGATG